LLAHLLTEVADWLDRNGADDLVPAVVNQLPMVARVNDAWRAFQGTAEKRHKRLVLIECIDAVAEMASPQIPPPRLSKLVQTFYAVSFPELAHKLDLKALEAALEAWNNQAGRPTSRESRPKWVAIDAVAVSAGIPSASPASIQREWEKFRTEVVSRKTPA
jgi:hypothetical protein